jgi:hypothetical protein
METPHGESEQINTSDRAYIENIMDKLRPKYFVKIHDMHGSYESRRAWY